jgi:sirohydrochlorin ferrochelatase
MLRRLEEAYRRQGDTTTRFYISFLDDNPRPDAAVIQALNDGASHIIVSEVFLSISNHTGEGKELIEAIGVEEYGATLRFSGPLWDSELLQRMPVTRTNAHIGDSPKSNVGVLLVGHGQPDEWDQEWPTETEHELRFRQEALRLFVEDGYRPENVSLAWMEFKKPEPAEKIAEFRRNGVDKVFYFSAAISAESIHSQFDVPALVHKGNHSRDLSLLNLGAWNDDPLVIRAIKEKIDAQRQTLIVEVPQPALAVGDGRAR